MATFYTGVDKQRYDAGEKFLPMNKFLASYTPPKTNLEAGVTPSYGIPNTNAFTYGGGNNYYPGKTSNLVSNFNRDIQAYNERIKEGNRPLREAQFPSFPNISNAQNIYNRSQGYLDKGYPGTYTDTSMHGKSLSEINKMANEQIMDHHEKARTGQFGPSYIPAEKPTLKRKISDFVYDNVPYIDRPQSYEDIMTSGYQEPEGPGLPTIFGFINKMGIQNFANLPQADQAFIASQRGYTGPTVFGENTTGLNVDPFGKNVESLFGNYAQGVKDDFDKLNKHFAKDKTDKDGNVVATWNADLGKYEGTEADYWNQMNKMNITRWNFRKNQINKQKDISSDLSLMDQARAYDIQQAQGRIDRDETDINRAAAAKDSASGASTVNPHSAYGKAQGYIGGNPNPHTDTGWSGSTKGGFDTGGGKEMMATGGRVYLNLGGLAGLL